MKSIDRNAETESHVKEDFPVIGIGASAGGLDALDKFFRYIPANIGCAFVIIQHLDPNHESLMVELLTKKTPLSVHAAEDGVAVLPNHVYMIPPNTQLTIQNGVLRLRTPTERRGLRMPINHFFRSLAADRGELAMGIIFSGTGSDGTLGLEEIKAHGGMTMALEPDSAQYASMPRNAIATGQVDVVKPAKQLAESLKKYIQHPYLSERTEFEELNNSDKRTLDDILTLIRSRNRHDFRGYKRNSLLRRIKRRMGLRHVEKLSEYYSLLEHDDEEIEKLIKDLLINVTEFFRMPDAWKALKKVVPQFLENRDIEDPIRIWVPGCSSGQEAYSLSIIMHELQQGRKTRYPLQIFATDVDMDLLETARAGIFHENICTGIPPKYLRNYFTKHDSFYHVKKMIREPVVFAAQNLLRDPPFSKLDMISCRNLLIYVEGDLQKSVTRLFHFALNENGILFLGSSESVAENTEFFRPVSKKWRIYKRVGSRAAGYYEAPYIPSEYRTRKQVAGSSPIEAVHHEAQVSRLAERILLEQYVPASLLIDKNHRILYYFGNTDPYLQHPQGEPTNDMLTLVRPGLRPCVRTAMNRAQESNREVTERTCIGEGSDSRTVEMNVRPFQRQHEFQGFFLLSFRDIEDRKRVEQAPRETLQAENAIIEQLQQELKTAKNEMHDTLAEMEIVHEELRTANEEAMSTNEELQSTVEELETSKEELQSLNEELNTVNNQLEEKIRQLEMANNDLNNLLTSTDIATLFLDRECRIMRFTPTAGELFIITPSDVGRPIDHIRWKFGDSELLRDIQKVLKNPSPAEAEVLSDTGCWYNRRVVPYRTEDNRIEGIVVTFADITEIKTFNRRLQQSEQRFRTAIEYFPSSVFIYDTDRRISYVNKKTVQESNFESEQLIGKLDEDLYPQEVTSLYIPAIEQVLRTGKSAHVECTIPVDNDSRIMEMHFVPFMDEEGRLNQIMGIRHDITIIRNTEKQKSRLASIVNGSYDAIVGEDLDGHITSWNKGAVRIYRYGADEVVGKDIGIIVPPEKTKEQSRLFEQVKRGKLVVQKETTRLRKDGKEITVSLTLSPILDGEGTVVAISSITRDITKLKTVQEELERTRKREQARAAQLESFLRAVPAVVLIAHDTKARVITGNKKAYELFRMEEGSNLSKTAPRGKAPTHFKILRSGKVLKPEELPPQVSVRDRVEVHDIDLEVLFDDDSLVHLFGSTVPIFDENNTPTGAISAFLDVSDRVRMEQRLKDLNENLERRVIERTHTTMRYHERLKALTIELTLAEQRERRRISAMLHNYLAQMMILCRWKVQEIKEVLPDSKEKESLSEVDDSLGQCIEFSRTLIAELSPSILYEHGLVDALKWLAGQMKKYNLTVLVHANVEGVELVEDYSVLIYEAVRELLINARKHAGVDRVELTLRKQDHHLIVAVRDRGVGFTPPSDEDLNEEKGYGLFSIRERLRSMSGHLKIESKAGEGTCVTLSIPLDKSLE
jgi:two-component system CheB/CheR fusion protein